MSGGTKALTSRLVYSITVIISAFYDTGYIRLKSLITTVLEYKAGLNNMGCYVHPSDMMRLRSCDFPMMKLTIAVD